MHHMNKAVPMTVETMDQLISDVHLLLEIDLLKIKIIIGLLEIDLLKIKIVY